MRALVADCSFLPGYSQDCFQNAQAKFVPNLSCRRPRLEQRKLGIWKSLSNRKIVGS
jgi:hypothetical protein